MHEIRLYSYVKQLKITISAVDDNKAGPDFNTDLGYIECVSLTKGEKGTLPRECLETNLSGSVNRYLSALPRITSAIIDKHKKYQEYISRNILDKNKPRIIAISTSIFSNEFNSSLNIELVLKVLYGIGFQTMRFDMKEKSFIKENNVVTHAYDDKGLKPPNVILELDYFSKKSFSDISGVLLVNNAISEKLEKEYFNLLLNPNADLPINKNLLFGIKYFDLKCIENGNVYFQWYNQT